VRSATALLAKRPLNTLLLRSEAEGVLLQLLLLCAAPQLSRPALSSLARPAVVINVGSLIASTAIVTVQQEAGWTIGFGIPAIAMVVAVGCFVAGSARYKHAPRPVGGSPISRACRIVGQGLRQTRLARRSRSAPPVSSGEASEAARPGLVAQKLPSGLVVYPWLLRASREQGGGFSRSQVEEVATILRLLPIMFTGILFWAVYAQMSSAFVLQAKQMDCRLGSVTIQGATLSSFDTIVIIILIPLFDRVVYPAVIRRGYRCSNLQRTGVGYVFAVLAMLAAAAVERGRLNLAKAGNFLPAPPPPHFAPPSPDGASPAPADDVRIVALSVFAQIPQYCLVGTSEVLAAVAQLDWFYSEAPATMRSCGMALQLLSVALGGYLASAISSIISSVTKAQGKPWLPNDLDSGHLDLFFLVIACLMFLDVLLFWYCASRFVSVSTTPSAEAAEGDAVRERVEEQPLLKDKAYNPFDNA